MGTTDPAAKPYDAVVEGTSEETVDTLGKPVEVAVVGTVAVADRVPVSISTDQVPVHLGPAVRIVNAVPSRTRLTIKCVSPVGTDIIYIGGDQVTPGTGFQLTSYDGITVDARCELYAIAHPDNTGVPVLHLFSEHRDG